MNASIREEGVWWLPRAPKMSRCSATLIVEGKNARIEPVSSRLYKGKPATMGPELILGETIAGHFYSCFGTLYGGSTDRLGSPSFERTGTIQISKLMRGAHFKRVGDAVFNEAAWRYANLHLWMLNQPAFEVRREESQTAIVQKRGARGALWDVEIREGVYVSNDYTSSNRSSLKTASFTMSHLDGIRIRSNVPLRFQEFFPLERIFRSLVNLLADCQLELVSEIFRGGATSGEVTTVSRSWAGGFTKREDPEYGFVPVPFLGPELPAVISTWFKEQSRLEPIVNLYLYGKQNPFLDSINQFLGVMQALESFHRTFLGGTFMPEEAYAKDVAPRISSGIPKELAPDFRDRLKAAIRFGYEFSLNRRLKELAELLPAHAAFKEVRDKGFRVRSKDTRNVFTHQIRHPEHPPMKDEELYLATLRWREMLAALILQRLGMSEARIVAAAQQLRSSGGTITIW